MNQHSDDLDTSSVVLRRADVETVALDGEALLLVGNRTTIHVLSTSASAVWSRLDGSGPLDELVRGLAAELGRTPAEIESDVLQFVRDAGDAGLLAGIDPSPPRVPVSGPVMPDDLPLIDPRLLAEPPNT